MERKSIGSGCSGTLSFYMLIGPVVSYISWYLSRIMLLAGSYEFADSYVDRGGHDRERGTSLTWRRYVPKYVREFMPSAT